VLTSPGGKVATGATAIGADVLGIDELRQQKRQQRQATSKAMPSVGQMSEGLQRGWKALIPTDHPVVQQMLGRSKSAGANAKSGFSRSRTGGLLGKPKAGQADSGSFQLGQAAGNLVNAATANTGTKIGTGVAATGLAGHAYGTHQRNKAAQASYGDPYSYGKADDAEVIWKGTFTEVDPDKQLAFGWASVVEMNGMPVIDRQGDVITPDDMEDAAYAYVLKSRKGGNMHARAADGGPHQVSQMVESFVVTDEKVEKMGLPEDTPRGWWVGFQIHDPDTWAMIRSGERTGFSIHGHGRRTEVPVDSVMGYA